jgi:autotransporter-associated beta strand protein
MNTITSRSGYPVIRRIRTLRHAAFLSLSLGFFTTASHAANGTWNVDAAGNWSTAANWAGSTIAGNNAGDVANLTFNLTAARTVTVDGTNKTIGVLNIGDSDNTSAYTLGGSVSIYFNNGASDGQINQISTSKGDTITDPIAVGGNGNLTITNASANTLTMGAYTASGSAGAKTLTINNTGPIVYSGPLTNGSGGALALVKSGTGALTVSGSNSFTGGATLNAGTLNIATYNGQALGTGAFIINGGTINNTYGGALTLVQNNPQSWNGNFTFAGTGPALNLGTGAVTMNASRTVTVNGSTLTVGGGIAGTGFALTKAGAGTLVLNGANTYTGVTTISGGKLQFGKQASLYNATTGSWTATNLIVNSGTTALFNVGGTGEFTATDIDTIKSLGTASGGFKSGSTLGFDTTNATGGAFDYASVIANPNAGANVLNLVKSGANTLALSGANTYSGNTTLSSGILALNHPAAISTGTLTINGGALDNTSGSSVTLTNNNAQNWNGNFAFTGTNDLNLGTGAVAMNANRIVTVTASSLTVGGVVSGTTRSLTLAGNGTLVLDGANTYTGGTTITGGTLSANTLTTGGVASSIGASTSAAANLVLNGGTLRYTGATTSTDRLFTLGTTAGSALDASGSGAINFANTGSCVLSGTNTARTLTLTGTNTGNNTLAGIITDNGTGATSLVKSGGGTWLLSGVNTYTGGTTVTGGTLVTDATGTIGTGNLTLAGGNLVLGNASALSNNATFTFSPSMGAGSINLNFTGVKALAALTNGTLYAVAGTYNAAQLNTFFGTSVFSGSGSFVIGSWVTVPLGGGGYVSGLACDSTGTDIYCRTDVGGALRWVPSTGEWISITDTLVPTTTAGSEGAMNTAAIAVDPSNANNLYVAVGQLYSTVKGIYASTDKGATWTKINPSNPITMDGNGAYRGLGERLAVDPNNSNIVWFGSTQDGLQKGVKSGSTWTWTQVAATDVPFGQVTSTGKAGVSFVVCDKNGGSTITYAGVFDSVGTTGGVYQSLNGLTWTKVSGITIATPRRGQVASNGTLYVTGYNVVGRMLRGGSLTDITPLAGIDYRGVAVDPNDATGDTVYVAEGNSAIQFNKMWRSTSGGASGTWTTQYKNFNDNLAIARTEPDGTKTLTGYWFGAASSLLVNPANSNELWAADFFGVARTQNAQNLGGTTVGSQSIWYMLQKNQEEVCVETLKNAPTGPELMAGVADVGGFRYNDISQRPYGTAGNAFTNPSEKNNTSLDFCESSPNVWVRTWGGGVANGGNQNVFGTGAYSQDAGATWVSFGQVDGHLMTSGAAGWETFDLTTYLATQKAKGNNIVTLMLSSGYSTNGAYSLQTFASKEYGTTTLRPKLVINGSTNLTPTDDATVLGIYPNNNYGVSGSYGVYGTIEVAYNGSINDWYRHAYIKFDLSSVSTITSATLNLYRLAASSGFQVPIGLFACADTSWSQSTLTWNTRPMPYSSSVGQPFNDPRYTTTAGVSLSGGRVAISATDPNLLVWMPFGSSVVPHYSNDRGVTWTPCSGLPANVNWLLGKSFPSYLIQQLTADRVNGTFYIEHLYSNTGSPAPKLIYKSTDGGANWTYAGSIPYGPGNYTNNVWRTQIVAAPAAGHVWVTDDGISDVTKGGLWKSTNGGTTTAQLPNISGVRVVSFGKPPAGSPSLYSTYFMGYYGGVKGIYRSDDYGSSWVALPALPSDVSIECIAGDRQVHGSVFFGTGGRGIFQTQ